MYRQNIRFVSEGALCSEGEGQPRQEHKYNLEGRESVITVNQGMLWDHNVY